MADRSSIDAPFNFAADARLEGMRLGWLPAAFDNEGVTEVDRAALAAAKRLGLELVELDLPDLPYGSLLERFPIKRNRFGIHNVRLL